MWDQTLITKSLNQFTFHLTNKQKSILPSILTNTCKTSNFKPKETAIPVFHINKWNHGLD